MAMVAEITQVPDWEAKFNANFDSAAFWSRIASHAAQRQPYMIPDSTHQQTTQTIKQPSSPET
ncbi:Hypothetical predicted protein, partial [Pelobates cultripes]